MDWSNLNFSNTNTTLPAVNLLETDDEYVIELAAPGMKKEDFKLSIDNNTLTISSEKKEEHEEKKGKQYTRREFSYQSFQRSFALPAYKADAEKVTARYTDGILHILVPKREEAKPKAAREIQIS